MSRIDFRTGDLGGRLGGLVGSIWKGIPYVKRFVVPANPNTVAQQNVRATFASLVQFARRINSTVLKTWTLPKPKKKSPFNEFISRNKSMIQSGSYDLAGIKIGVGSLFTPPTFGISADAGTDDVTVSISSTIQGEAQSSDPLAIIVFNQDTDTFAFELTETRGVGVAHVTIPMTIGDAIYCWGFCIQGENLSTNTKFDTQNAT